MRDSVSTYLGAVARRLLLARAAEALAGGAAAGGAVSLPLMTARIVGERHPSWALVPALLPLLAGASVALMRFGRRAGGASRWLFVLMATAASATLVVDIATPAPMAVPHGSIPLVLVCLGGFGAASAVLVGGVSRRDAALYVDRHADLAERLTTAVELERCGGDAGFARAVRRKADEAVQRCRALPLRYWRRTRTTPALAALVLLACVVVASVRPLQPGRKEGMARVGRQIVAQAARLQQRAQTSGPAALGPLAHELRQLGRTMQQGQVTLDQAIRRLDRVERALGSVPDGGQPVHRIANDLRRQKERLAAAGGGETHAADDEVVVDPRIGGADAPGTTGQAARPEIGSAEAPASWRGAGTRVFSGGSIDRSESRPADPAGRSLVGPDAGDPYAPLDRSWLAARRRAARALDDRIIPIRHRRLIRGYFGDER